VSKDWVAWHRDYEDPSSSLARRLEVVQRELRTALALTRPADGESRLLSICAGDGRDVLPVLAERGRDVRALLVELDPLLCERARSSAAELGLTGVEIRTGDAGVTDAYRGFTPAHVVLACGVFGNITVEDGRQTVAALPSLLRGRRDRDLDPGPKRRWCRHQHGDPGAVHHSRFHGNKLHRTRRRTVPGRHGAARPLAHQRADAARSAHVHFLRVSPVEWCNSSA